MSLEGQQRLMLADRYAQLGLWWAARAVYQTLVQDPELVAVAQQRLGRLVIDSDPRDALAYGRRAAAGAADEADRIAARVLLGDAALSGGDLDQAEEHYQKVLASTDALTSADAARCRFNLAIVAHERGAGDAVIETVQQLASDESLPPYMVEEVVGLAEEAGEVAALLEALPPPDEMRPVQRMLQALALEVTGARRRAVEEALEKAGDLPPARLALALRLARRRGRDQSARSRAVALLEGLLQEQASGVSPPRIRLLLASIQDDDDEQVAAAAEHYQRALDALPRDAVACHNLGVIALRTNDRKQAQQWLLRALFNDPLHEKSYLNLARTLYGAGSPQSMVGVLEQMKRLGMDARCLANLCFALVEVAREDAHDGMAHRGHQLKNLLGVIATRLRSVARVSEGDARERLDRICAGVSDLYDDWATYLRTMREEAAATIDTVDLNELVAEAARRAGGRAHLRLADRLPEVLGVGEQLLEALVNLVRNACESQDEAAAVRISTELVAGGSTVQVTITDDGPGIPTGDLRRVFAPGYTTKQEGSGLGLAITERVVRAHHGHLEIDSREGVGTKVQMRIPVHLESEVRHRLRRVPLSKMARSAAAEEYVLEE